MHRWLLGPSVGSLKLITFGYSLKSHEQSSQINTRQGIHESTDVQDVLYYVHNNAFRDINN